MVTWHHSAITQASWHLKSSAIWLFLKQFVQAGIKENIKPCITATLWWQSTDDQWIPIKKISNTEGVSMSWPNPDYRKISNIRRTKFQNLNDSRLVLQLSMLNPLKPVVK